MAEGAQARTVTAPVAAPTADPPRRPSPLAAARLLRRLTVEEAARRAGLRPEEVEWLEGGPAVRFCPTLGALAASVVYAPRLEVAPQSACGLARRPGRHLAAPLDP